MKRPSPLLALGFAACGTLSLSGAAAPTDHTFKLTPADIAYVEDDTCEQTWVTGNSKADLEVALGLLVDLDVRIVQGNPVAAATALEHRLAVSQKYFDYNDSQKVSLLSHELVHYCHRGQMGDREFEASYAHSSGRWRTEVPAFLQDFRTMRIQCASVADVEAAIEKRLLSFRDRYLLWDIDPDQYIAETRRIWSAALEVGSC